MSRTKRIIEEVNSIHHDYVAVVTPEKKKQRRFKEEPLEEVKSHKEEKDDDDRKIAPNVKEESQLDEEKDNDDDGDDRKIAPNIKEESQRGEEKDNDDDRKMAPYVKEESLLNEGRIIKEVNNIHHDYAAVVTPERNPNPNSIHEEKDDDNDRKMAPNEKEESQADEGLIDGDTIMGFPLHPNLTNRQILLGHYAFVTWARRQTEPRGRLIPFLEWCDSDEARALELEGRGNQKFTFGMYDGKAFYQIYKEDPTYHIRYTFMLRKARKEAPGTLIRYIAWISDYEKSM